MKKILFIALCLLLINHSNAQNLVPNNSFNTITSCPNSPNQIYYAPPWFQPCIFQGNVTNSSSSDLYDTCGTAVYFGIPYNQGGYQSARTGAGYAGIIVYNNTNNYREYIEVPLLNPLIANRNYCIEFYVSLADFCIYQISNIGAYFSVDSLLDSTNLHAIDYVTAQVENPINNMLNDTVNWMLISGNYIANGGEKFITIGNFRNVANTNVQTRPYHIGIFSYYYIDDVSVVDCTSGVGVQELGIKNVDFKLYPNPTNGNFTLEYNLEGNDVGILSIYDIAGKLIKNYPFNSNNASTTINASQLEAGVYFYKVMVNDELKSSDKIIIIK